MADEEEVEEVEDGAEPADLDDEELDDEELDEEGIGEDDLAEEGLGEEGATEETAEDEEEDTATDRPTRAAAAASDDDEEEPDPDDVEADLDSILKERIAANDDDEEDEEEEKPGRVTKGTEDDGSGENRVAPRKAGEFVCTSCFLVKPNMQLADPKKKLCADCV